MNMNINTRNSIERAEHDSFRESLHRSQGNGYVADAIMVASLLTVFVLIVLSFIF